MQVQPACSAAEFLPDCLVVVSGFETGTSDFAGSEFAYLDGLLDRAALLDSRTRGPAAVLAGIDEVARHNAGGATRVATLPTTRRTFVDMPLQLLPELG
eukprot:COSAG02_NODE_13192_length_1429_cov_1.529323_2_plen_99_part_00